MSALHPLATKGGFLPSERETIFIDSSIELNHLIEHILKDIFPDASMTDAHEFVMRSLLIRMQQLGNVMYGSACAADEDLKHYLSNAYGHHHSFKQTEADDESAPDAPFPTEKATTEGTPS